MCTVGSPAVTVVSPSDLDTVTSAEVAIVVLSVAVLLFGVESVALETVTEFVPNELIVYEITKGSPLKNHRGEMRFTPEAGGTHLHYEVSFSSKLPGVDIIVAQGLRRNIAKGLTRVQAPSQA